MEQFRYRLQPSPFGPVAIVWHERNGIALIRRIFLPRGHTAAGDLAARAFPRAMNRSCPEIDRLGSGVRDFLDGQPVDLDIRLLDLSQCTPFQRRVLLAESRIPRGWTSTYGRIARHLELPNAARAVGTALARNPFPVMIPCHRAIRGDGGLGGFQGGVAMKRALLEYEGIRFSRGGTVVAEHIFY